jgi:hypothetical protein
MTKEGKWRHGVVWRGRCGHGTVCGEGGAYATRESGVLRVSQGILAL